MSKNKYRIAVRWQWQGGLGQVGVNEVLEHNPDLGEGHPGGK